MSEIFIKLDCLLCLYHCETEFSRIFAIVSEMNEWHGIYSIIKMSIRREGCAIGFEILQI